MFEAIGITLGAEIRRGKIECAKRLFVQTNLSGCRCCKHSGFTDLRHIEDCFRQELGCTPSQFRCRVQGG